MYEFSGTPSGNLTVNEFQTLWLEEEKDPPAYVRAREKKFASAKSVDTPLKHARSDDEHESHDDELPTPPLTEDNIDDEESQSTLREMMEILEREDTERLEKSLSSYGLMEEGDENLSDLDDDLEVQNMLAVSTDEVEFKTMLWTDENKDWLAAQEAKKLQESDKHNPPRSKAQKKVFIFESSHSFYRDKRKRLDLFPLLLQQQKQRATSSRANPHFRKKSITAFLTIL